MMLLHVRSRIVKVVSTKSIVISHRKIGTPRLYQYIKQNVDNKPTNWKDLKAIMRHKFVPPYYRRELLRNLEQLKQGSNTVHAYYQEFKCYMHKCDIEEFEDDRKNRFFNGLNDDIRARFHYIPRCIVGMYVRACT